MKRIPFYLFTSILLALLLGGCYSLKVTYDYDKSVDFSKYKTYQYYGWAKESDKLLNQIDRRRFEEAFAEEFARRGLTLVDSGGDLMVSLFIVVQQKKGVTYTTDHYGYYGGYYGYGPGWGWGPSYSTTTAHEYDYMVGTLVVDVFDQKSEKLVWEGIGSKTVDENPQSREKNIPRAVAEIMYYYPVKPKSGK